MNTFRLDRSLIGQTLGKGLVVERFLGEGGMGTTYVAFQPELDRRICIKFLQKEFVADQKAFRRFTREAQSLSQLHHPNIVACYFFDVACSIYPYFAMEYVEGTSLRSLIQKEGRIEWKRACKIAIQVCRALDYAHKQSFVHRDIKPDNIVLANGIEGDYVKLLDFGLVGLLSSRGDVTRTGEVLGSIPYMAPEVCVDSSSASKAPVDIYSLACTLYEMIEGQPPFCGSSTFEIMQQHCTQDLPALSTEALTADQAKGLDLVLRYASARNPSDRYQSANEFADALESLLSHPSRQINQAVAPEQTLVSWMRSFLRRSQLQIGMIVVALLLVSVVAFYPGSAVHSTMIVQLDLLNVLSSRNPEEALLKRTRVLARNKHADEALSLIREYLRCHRSLSASGTTEVLATLRALANEFRTAHDIDLLALADTTRSIVAARHQSFDRLTGEGLREVEDTLADIEDIAHALIEKHQSEANYNFPHAMTGLEPALGELEQKVKTGRTGAANKLALQVRRARMDVLASEGRFDAAVKLMTASDLRRLAELKAHQRSGRTRMPDAPNPPLLSGLVIDQFPSPAEMVSPIGAKRYFRILLAAAALASIDGRFDELAWYCYSARPFIAEIIGDPGGEASVQMYVNLSAAALCKDECSPSLAELNLTPASSMRKNEFATSLGNIVDIEIRSHRPESAKRAVLALAAAQPKSEATETRLWQLGLWSQAEAIHERRLREADMRNDSISWCQIQVDYLKQLSSTSGKGFRSVAANIADSPQWRIVLRSDGIEALKVVDGFVFAIANRAEHENAIANTDQVQTRELLTNYRSAVDWLIKRYRIFGPVLLKNQIEFGAYHWLCACQYCGLGRETLSENVMLSQSLEKLPVGSPICVFSQFQIAQRYKASGQRTEERAELKRGYVMLCQSLQDRIYASGVKAAASGAYIRLLEEAGLVAEAEHVADLVKAANGRAAESGDGTIE